MGLKLNCTVTCAEACAEVKIKLVTEFIAGLMGINRILYIPVRLYFFCFLVIYALVNSLSYIHIQLITF